MVSPTISSVAVPYRVLARVWRPQRFEDVIGQGPIVRSLSHAIQQRQLVQAYLFSGMRGVGKTTMARLLAKALNCVEGPTVQPCTRCPVCREVAEGASLDVIELDGASHNSVDDARALVETVKYMPNRGRYKVYIIDEVHMLSTAAFNVLLKTLEEPPAHVVFIFATTEVQKVPATVLSRCQHYIFRRLALREIMERLHAVSRQEEIEISERGLRLLARAADGSLRDALGLLEQAVAYAGRTISDEALTELVGTVGPDRLMAFVDGLARRDLTSLLGLIQEVQDRGADLKRFTLDLLDYLRTLLILKMTRDPAALLGLSPEDDRAFQAQASQLTVEEIQRLFALFAKAVEDLRGPLPPSLILEWTVVQAGHLPPGQSVEHLVARLEALEQRLRSESGAPSSPLPPPPGPPPQDPNEIVQEALRLFGGQVIEGTR